MLFIPGVITQEWNIVPLASVVGDKADSSYTISANSFSFMFYNTENLFDVIDDTLKEDEEFLPGGSRGWNYNKYYRKLHAIAKVLLSAGEWEPPAIIGLCETENKGVAESLLKMTPLSSFNYGIVYIESNDIRGIDVCLLYNKEVAEVQFFRIFEPNTNPDAVLFTSRPVLYIKMKAGGEILHLMINHWPSRRGGVLAAQQTRMDMAEMVKGVTDSIFISDESNPAIIVAGDFNCSPTDKEMRYLCSDGRLVNLAEDYLESDIGTYRYRGVWQVFDQILVSESMVNGNSPFMITESRIHSPEFLLTTDHVYPGRKPFSTFDGYTYTGGYSDHLPVMIRVNY